MVNAINTNHQAALRKASEEIANKQDIVKRSPYRLNYHFMAPTGWINDPNGLVQYKGEYQLFYQYYPYASSWGPMHWGHAKSKDLVHWEHLPVALAPSEPYDSGDVPGYGCFSGSAVVDGEELVLIYTGHVDGNQPQQVQCIATSEDGVSFEKYAQNPVIDKFPVDGSKDFRDPKVWQYEDRWYMVIGSKKDGKGKALLYVSDDLKHWEYKGVAAESDGTQGDMWECLNLENKEIVMNREYSSCGDKGVSKAPIVVKQDGSVTLRIFMDTTSIEIFVNDGEQTITNRIYPDVNSNQFKIFTRNGKVSVNSVESWKLNSVWN